MSQILLCYNNTDVEGLHWSYCLADTGQWELVAALPAGGLCSATDSRACAIQSSLWSYLWRNIFSKAWNSNEEELLWLQLCCSQFPSQKAAENLCKGLVRRQTSKVLVLPLCSAPAEQGQQLPHQIWACLGDRTLLPLPHRQVGHFSWAPLQGDLLWKKGLRSLHEKACNWDWLPHLKHLFWCLCNRHCQMISFLKYPPCPQEAVVRLSLKRLFIYTSAAISMCRRVVQCRKGTHADPVSVSMSTGMRCSLWC